MEVKTKVRKEMKEQRLAMEADDSAGRSELICDTIISSNLYENAHMILLYASSRNEVDLKKILLHALATGKKVFFPKVHGDTMDFYMVHKESDLSPGAFGIHEPNVDTISIRDYIMESISSGEITDLEELAIPIFTPGVAFSEDGNRIGYGRGYYDSFLFQMEEWISMLPVGSDQVFLHFVPIGVCYEFQIVENVAFEKKDYRMKYIVTEQREVLCDE